MPNREVLLSWKEDRDVTGYAARHGISPEELIKTLALDNLQSRLRFKRTPGEVRTFESPKRR